jgi:toxin CcdB
MARFDVYTFSGRAPLVVDVQADLLAHIGSRVIIPLLPCTSKGEAIPRLKPTVMIGGKEYQLATTDLVAVPAVRLGTCVGNLEDQRNMIVDAIDFLLQGF